MSDAGNGRGAGNGRSRAYEISATERNVVAGHVLSVGDKSRTGREDLGLIGGQCRAGVTVHDTLETQYCGLAVGLQRAIDELVVEPRREYAALLDEFGPEIRFCLIVLIMRDRA